MDRELRVDRTSFLELLKTRFPSVYEAITDLETGLLHMEMGVFSHATRFAIEEARWDVVAEHYDLIANFFSKATPDVKNAIYVSYLENILLGESSENFVEARRILPSILSTALIDLEKHFAMLAEQAEIVEA